jgi:hypothetical protein
VEIRFLPRRSYFLDIDLISDGKVSKTLFFLSYSQLCERIGCFFSSLRLFLMEVVESHREMVERDTKGFSK